jgi:hypothetical protein
MALTTCDDCGHAISTAAAACPNCGAPLGAWDLPGATEDPAPAQSNKVWKALQLLGAAGIIVGGTALLIIIERHRIADLAPPPSTILAVAAFGIGLMVFIAGRAGAWWHSE